jgi:hypothetical protein
MVFGSSLSGSSLLEELVIQLFRGSRAVGMGGGGEGDGGFPT